MSQTASRPAVASSAFFMKIVIHPPVESARLQKIANAAPGAQIVNARDASQLLHEIEDADALLGKVTPAALAAARRLRWIQSFTASLEHYVFPELVEHPAVLTNMRGLYGDVIADHVFGLITCFCRNLHVYIRQQSRGLWRPVGGAPAEQPFDTGPAVADDTDRAHRRLADATLGIVGLGQIGREIARRGFAYGMRTFAVDPKQTNRPESVESLWPPAELGKLLAESDFVVIAVPQTPDTERLFSREQFSRMRRGAYLINVGRGAVVDLAALVDALQAGEIAGAGLDVCEVEPLPADHPLWRMENVIITPHIAARSPRIAERHLATLLENVRRFATGKPLENVVDKANWF